MSPRLKSNPAGLPAAQSNAARGSGARLAGARGSRLRGAESAEPRILSMSAARGPEPPAGMEEISDCGAPVGGAQLEELGGGCAARMAGSSTGAPQALDADHTPPPTTHPNSAPLSYFSSCHLENLENKNDVVTDASRGAIRPPHDWTPDNPPSQSEIDAANDAADATPIEQRTLNLHLSRVTLPADLQAWLPSQSIFTELTPQPMSASGSQIQMQPLEHETSSPAAEAHHFIPPAAPEDESRVEVAAAIPAHDNHVFTPEVVPGVSLAEYSAAAPSLEMEFADVDDDVGSVAFCDAPSDLTYPSDEAQLINPTPATLRAFRSSRRLAMSALLRGEKISEVARIASVSRGTIATWMKTQAFAARLKSFDEQTLSRYSRKLESAAVRSVDALDALQDHEDPEVVIKAASRIMSSADRIIDRSKGITDAPIGPLIVFPPGTKIAVLAQTPSLHGDQSEA